MRCTAIIGFAVAALTGVPVEAQSEYGGGWGAPSLKTSLSIGRGTINSEMISRNGAAARRDARAGRGNDGIRTSSQASAEGSIAPLSVPMTFASTRTSLAAAQTAYLALMKAKDQGSARPWAGQFRANDFGRVYANLVRPFGLRANDAADALAGYTILGWLIATAAPDPSPPTVRER